MRPARKLYNRMEVRLQPIFALRGGDWPIIYRFTGEERTQAPAG